MNGCFCFGAATFGVCSFSPVCTDWTAFAFPLATVGFCVYRSPHLVVVRDSRCVAEPGDGTIRKEPGVFARWHPDFGADLHRLQVAIALRGVALLKVGQVLLLPSVVVICLTGRIANDRLVSVW